MKEDGTLREKINGKVIPNDFLVKQKRLKREIEGNLSVKTK